MRRRQLGLAVAACALGAAVALLAAGQPWARAQVVQGPLRLALAPSGRTLAPLVAALGVVALAGAVAIAATRRAARLVTGVLLSSCGAVVAIAALRTRADLARALAGEAGRAVGRASATPVGVVATSWPWVAAAGGALITAAGLLTVARGRGWPAMSARYDAPAGRPQVPATAERPSGTTGMWDAQDRGDDPTR